MEENGEIAIKVDDRPELTKEELAKQQRKKIKELEDKLLAEDIG
jgi:hypothetical protein